MNPDQRTAKGDSLGADGTYYPMQNQLVQQPIRELASVGDVAAAPEASTWKNIVTVLHALRRRWLIGLSIGLSLGAAAAYAAWKYTPAPYTAYREVRIRTQAHVGLTSRSQRAQDFRVYKQTQMKLVRSRSVLSAAISDPKVAQLPLLQQQENQIEWLQTHLIVRESGTEFFRISLVHENRSDLIPVLNAVTEAFKTEVVDKEVDAIEKRITFVEKQRAAAQARSSALRSGLKELNKTKAAGSERLTHILDNRLQVNNAIRSTQREIRDLEVLLQLHHRVKKRHQDRIKNFKVDEKTAKTIDKYVAENQEHRDLKRQLDAAKRLLKLQQSELTSNHPNIAQTQNRLRQLSTDLDSLRARLRPEIVQRIIGSLPREKVRLTKPEIEFRLEQHREHLLRSTAELEGINKQLKDAGVAEVDLDEKEKEIESSEKFEARLSSDITYMKFNRQLRDEEPRITISDRSEISTKPDTKKRLFATAGAGCGTFGLLLAGIVLLDIRSRRISSIQQLVDRVGLPVLGSVPVMPRHATRKKGRWNARAQYWHGVLTESINSARTFLMRQAEGMKTPVVMVTSALGGEGKTTIASHLATSLARAGKNVLLVDGDMRRPFIHRVFGHDLVPGVAEVIRNEIESDAAIQQTDIPNLAILSGGVGDQLSAQLLAQERVSELLSAWRSHYDFVIVDSAPVLPVTDTLLISQHVDGVLFAIRRDVSRATKVLSACQRLSLLGVPLLGAIAIGLDDESYGHRYSYSYGHSNSPSS